MGLDSVFKKIIGESSELVFLASDSYPFTIFYANEEFEKEIGKELEQRNLVGLGLDFNSYIFVEELVVSIFGSDYSFQLVLPHENEADCFLFHKGKKVRTHNLSSAKETINFLDHSPRFIGMGKGDFLSYLNKSAFEYFGFEKIDVIDSNLLSFIHENDRDQVIRNWIKAKESQEQEELEFRFLNKHGNYIQLKAKVLFQEENFSLVAEDFSTQKINSIITRKKEFLQDQVPELAGFGTWIFDASTNAFSFDNSAAKLLDLPNNCSLKGSKVAKIKKKVLKLLAKELRGEQAGEYKVLWNKDVEKGVYINFKWEPLINSKSNQEFVGVVWDNSRKEKENRKTEFYKSLFVESQEALLLVKKTGDIIMINNEARKLFDISSRSSIVHLNDLLPYLIDDESWEDWIKAKSKNQKVPRIITSMVNKEGRKLSVEVGVKEFELEGEKTVSLSFRDITEKVSLENSLAKNSDFLMNLTEQVPGGLYQMVVSPEGKTSFSFLSKGISSVLGVSIDEIKKMEDISFAMTNVHPDDLPKVIMSSVASAKLLEPWQCQFRVRVSPESSDFNWVLGAARPQTLENGDMIWYGYLTDISRQKEFESRLDEAKRAAEKANQIKSDFLSMISHELRTPLNAISGSVYSLLHDSPTRYQKNALSTINFAVDNLIIMINDLLDFQKIEAGKLSIEKAPFHLADLLSQIVKGLTFHARDSKNKLQIDIDKQLELVVKGDKTRISQVLNNLITNALKFTDKGNVSVRAELISKTESKIRVYFEVKDNGIGIALENQNKIFNDFDQVKPTFSTKYGGTGLGLSITKKLLQIMGSSIHLESEEGVGSRFFFELEFDLTDDLQNDKNTDIDPIKPVQNLHLLMAEDNEVNALVLGKIISKWGFTYDRVVNGKEAVEALNKGHYDCVLMDIQMPVMNGFEATLEIKKISSIPVIALTAAAKLEIIEKIEECDFDGFVSKPINASELLNCIQEVIINRDHKL